MQNYQAQDRFSDEDIEQEVNLREYYFIILKRKIIVFTILAAIFFITLIATFSTTPLYTSSSEVVIERNHGSAGLDNQNLAYDPEFLETQSAIITSMKVARRVVDTLKLATVYRHSFLPDKKDPSSFFAGLSTGIDDFFKNLFGPKKHNQDEGGAIGSTPGERGETLSDEDREACEKHQDRRDCLHRQPSGLGQTGCRGRGQGLYG